MLDKRTSTEREISKTQKIIRSIKEKLNVKKKNRNVQINSTPDDFHLFI